MPRRFSAFAARILNHRSFGAASGAPGGTLTDFAINDEFMKQLAESIRPGDATLFLLMKEITADKVGEQINDYGGVVLKTSSLIPWNKCYVMLLLAPLRPMRASNPDRGARASRHQGGVAALIGVQQRYCEYLLQFSRSNRGKRGSRTCEASIQADDKRVPLAARAMAPMLTPKFSSGSGCIP